MILTRCSYCGTVFRVTPEQLRIRNGQVRCGQCEAVFNALDFLEEETDIEALLEKSFNNHIPAVPVPTLEPVSNSGPNLGYTPTGRPTRLDAAHEDDSDLDDYGVLPSPVRRRSTSNAPTTSNPATPSSSSPDALPDWGNERPESLAQFVRPKPKPPTWPYTMLAIPLLLLLIGQVLYTYRTPLSNQYALVSGLFHIAGVEVPLSRQSELLALDSTDLQADAPNQQLVLMGTLRNQAPYNQAWPSLELTLLDTTNTILSRRVLAPKEYLPTDAPPVLAARSERNLNLRFSAEGLAPANYRLYVFYP